MALFVLGAGATRGCSFVDETPRPCRPPLDSDFFTQLQRVENPKHRLLIDEVVKDVVALFGNNFSVTLETMFATLEHTIRMLATTGDNREFKRANLVEMRERLLQGIAVVLEESLCRDKDGKYKQKPQECKHHAMLVEEVLESGDDLISLNYDCTIDFALKDKGGQKWNPRDGYGFAPGYGGGKLSGHEYWAPKEPSARDSTIHLYKLHGSLHFQIGAQGMVRLKQRPYTKQHGNLKFSIIAPESNKPYDKGVFADLWKGAAEAIKGAEHIVIIGYSMPVTDLHSNALFRTSVGEGGLTSLVVVNPDPEARKRIRSVFQRGLNEGSRVLSFASMEEFLATSVETWRR